MKRYEQARFGMGLSKDGPWCNCDEVLVSIAPALNLLREYIESVGGCDHEVNVCICEDKRVLAKAEEFLFGAGK